MYLAILYLTLLLLLPLLFPLPVPPPLQIPQFVLLPYTNHYYYPYCIEMDRSTIDEVVLVGGSTRIPRVKQQLR